MPSRKKKKVHCAIYTRKSHDEGLEQVFNSLDAQREAAEAYITSQQHEGWQILPAHYDDGGFTGANMNRPALTQLLENIRKRKIDIVVVYKVDRLSRSLADFSNLIELFDVHGVSFVSGTQQFNTSTSMGRLTLNVLLSFAQFEREVTAERIRDKIAVSKSKGLWMGGLPPLGYDPHPDKTVRGLVINQNEAKTVKQVFNLYNQLGCLRRVEHSANQQGLKSKQRKFASGRIQGGDPISRGAIHKLLTNPIYIGKIKHKDKLYDGLHKAIINDTLWQDVQDKLQAASHKRRGTSHNRKVNVNAPLKGKFFDYTGDPMTPTHTNKSGRIFRYYVSHRLIKGKDPSAFRFPAQQLEQIIDNLVRTQLKNTMQNLTISDNPTIDSIQKLQSRLQHWLNENNNHQKLETLELINKAIITKDSIKLTLHTDKTAHIIGCPVNQVNTEILTVNTPFTLKRRGVEAKLITGNMPCEADSTLQRALVTSHLWLEKLKSGSSLTLIAQDENITDSLIRTRLSLAMLSPEIQKAIMNGTQPVELTLEKIVRTTLPIDWSEQHQLLGFE